MRRELYLLALMVLLIATGCSSKRSLVDKRVEASYKKEYRVPKREMRAAWIQTVYQGEYATMTPDEMRRDFTRKLDKLKELKFNAIFFQVRPESDAWYKSRLEPWSRFLTGTQGVGPIPEWDPMEWLIKECHKRGLEFHAWINPYRAAANANIPLSPDHPYAKHPEWFFRYNNQLLYNPALPQSRRHISNVVADIVSRYDVDAIHMDDYFYPYPVAGQSLNDQAYFSRDPRGFSNIEDWRRDNVNLLVKEIKATIMAHKPWVRFGVSPFGIYRNRKSDKNGSNTNGLQNYDDLYADVLLWDREGWVDYIVPQLYWEMGHKSADYTELVYWWGKNVKKAHLYIGQDVKRTMDKEQLHPKMVMSREVAQGNVMWPANEIFRNTGGIQQELKENYFATPALVPPYRNMGAVDPEPVQGLRAAWIAQGYALIWFAPFDLYDPATAEYFVVYCFGKGEKVDLSNTDHIVSIQKENYYVLPYTDGTIPLTYVVTPLSRLKAEGKGIKITVKV